MLPLPEITLVDHMEEREGRRGTMKEERGKEDREKRFADSQRHSEATGIWMDFRWNRK